MRLETFLEQEYGLPVGILDAVVSAESGGRSDVVSRKGALGRYQLMPGTAKDLGVDPFDPIQSAEGAAMHLARDYQRFGSMPLAIAAYNAGPEAVARHRGIPPYKETQSFVAKVMNAFIPAAQAGERVSPEDIVGPAPESPAPRGRFTIQESDIVGPAEEAAPPPAPAEPNPQPTPWPGWRPTQPIQAGNALGAVGLGALTPFVAPTPDVPGVTPWRKVVKEAIGNVPASAAQVARTMVQPLLHPVDTAKALGDLAQGIWEKATAGARADPQAAGLLGAAGLGALTPGLPPGPTPGPHEATAASAASAIKQRYGTLEGFKQTLAKDPVGVLADVSSLLGVAGMAGRVPELARAAELLNPTRPVTGAARLAAKVTGGAAAEVAGRTTGAGAQALREAYQGGPGFKEALRGQATGEGLRGDLMGALQQIREKRREDYQAKLGTLKSAREPIDRGAVDRELQKALESFRVQRVTDPETGIATWDFSRSTIDRGARAPLGELIQDVERWDDWTPYGLDALKQRIDDFYAPNKNSRAVVTRVRNAVKQEIVKAVPEYADMTRGYKELSDALTDIEKGLSVGRKSMVDTAVRKLSTIFRDVNVTRLNQVRRAEELSGRSLAPALAGYSLQGWMPRGQLSSMLSGATVGGLSYLNPMAALAAPLLSPRLMGETARAAGLLAPYSRGALNLLDAASLPLWQAGRAGAGQ